MKAWAQQFLNDVNTLINAYPALFVFIIISIILMALLWVWIKVPKVTKKASNDSLLHILLKKLKQLITDFLSTIVIVFNQIFIRKEGQYDKPLFVALNPNADRSLTGALPINRTRRIQSDFARNLLDIHSQDKCLTLKELNLLDISISSLKNLTLVLKRIVKKRPQRPLDGLIVSIPIEYINEKNKQKTESLIELLTKSLALIDQQIPFHIPIYIVVSGCESLASYQAFAILNKIHQDEIFGWSSDQDFGSRYNTNLIHRAFHSISRSLRRNQVIRSCDPSNLLNVDDFVLIDHELSLLENNITSICDTIFEADSYQNGFEFRGLYFIGRDGQEQSSKQSSTTLFFNDLLEKKVAAEANLAVPTRYGHRNNENQLLNYKKYSLIAFVLLVTLGTTNLWSLNAQLNNVSTTIKTIQSSNNNGSGYGQVYKVLEQLSDFDARHFWRLGLPISWYSSADNELVKQVSSKQLSDIVFPEMECRVSQHFQAILSDKPSKLFDSSIGAFQWAYAGGWLNRLDDFQQTRNSFIGLSKPSGRTDGDALEQLSDLIFTLYDIKPADGFFNRSELYQRAIEELSYDYDSINNRCPNSISGLNDNSSSTFWVMVKENAKKLHTQIQNSSSLRLLEIKNDDQLSGTDFIKINNWLDYIGAMWVTGAKQLNPCRQIHKRLRSLDTNWNHNKNESSASIANEVITSFDEHNCARPFYNQLEQNKLSQVGAVFINQSGAQGAVSFSPSVITLRSDFDSLQGLTFMTLDTSEQPKKTNQSQAWDTSRLIKALDYYKEYEHYASANFSSLSLPVRTDSNEEAFVLQREILDQLNNAMNYELSLAQASKFETTNDSDIKKTDLEQGLIKQVHNFEVALELFYQIRDALSQLGFHASSNNWLVTTRASAHDILQSANTLVEKSRLYLPQSLTNKKDDNLISALYGINDGQEMKAYLLSQSQRANFIAQNYASSATGYLINTNSDQRLGQDFFENVWQQTLSELNKYSFKNPQNTLTLLEQQFIDAMSLGVDECPSTVVTGSGDDIFTQSQTQLMVSIIGYCGQSQQSLLFENYTSVADAFNENLKGRFPFVDNASLDSLSDASFIAVEDFFTQFDQISATLEKDLTEKAKFNNRYTKARDFITQLIEISTFFGDDISTANGLSNNSLKLNPWFKVRLKPSSAEQQIITQVLTSGEYSVKVPGTHSTLEWEFGTTLNFIVRVANSADYNLLAPKNGAQLLGQHTIKFSESGNWALLRMILKNRKSVATDLLTPKSGNLKLQFSIPIKPSNANSINSPDSSNEIKLLIGLDVYGINNKTKQLELKKVPLLFPSTAPTI